ncbi:hypothetical protein NDU88_005591, partial [Pleurodeles waltl]
DYSLLHKQTRAHNLLSSPPASDHINDLNRIKNCKPHCKPFELLKTKKPPITRGLKTSPQTSS